MKKDLIGNPVCWLLMICGVFVFLNIDSMWSCSSDLAQHYALAYRISEQWVLASSADPALGVMSTYPSGGHIIAAIVGAIVNSTFLGLHVTALLSLAIIWMSVILILSSLHDRLSGMSLICFTLFFSLAALTKFDFHGCEIITNYFYSQLVGTSVLFMAILFGVNIEKKYGPVWAIATLIVLMLLNETIHLLPSMEMLGLIWGLLFVYIFFSSEFPKNTIKRLLIAIPIFIFALFGAVLHPSFITMKAISQNNGGLEMGHIQYPLGIILLCLFVLLVSVGLFWDWFQNKDDNKNFAIKYLSIYGGVVASICLLQFMLTFLGYGSEYAVKKYEIGLISILLVELSIVFGKRLANVPFLTITKMVKGWLMVAALSIVLFLSVDTPKMLDVSDIVSLERRLITLKNTLLPEPENGKNNVAIGLDGMPSTINYMFSIAILKTANELAIPDVLYKSVLSVPSNYSYIVSSRSNPEFGAAGCKSLASGSLSIVTAECVEQRESMAVDCRSSIDFSKKSYIPNKRIDGFGAPEDFGRWTDGKKAMLRCTNNGPPAKMIRFQIVPFIAGTVKGQRLHILLNGVDMGVYELTGPRGANDPLCVKIPDAMDSDEYLLEFELPDATSPKKLGLGGDGRELGFSFQKIAFE